jgi:hypothetical protein
MASSSIATGERLRRIKRRNGQVTANGSFTIQTWLGIACEYPAFRRMGTPSDTDGAIRRDGDGLHLAALTIHWKW